ncbi:MAG: hypothetical protein R3A45_07730 [Bdellovibrionota bacterium]
MSTYIVIHPIQTTTLQAMLKKYYLLSLVVLLTSNFVFAEEPIKVTFKQKVDYTYHVKGQSSEVWQDTQLHQLTIKPSQIFSDDISDEDIEKLLSAIQ